MKHPLAKVIGLQSPPDGYTPEESQLEKILGEESVATLYNKLPTSRMKAIVALHFELGYKQELVARVFGVSQPQIGQEIRYIKAVFLNRPFRSTSPYKPRPHVARAKGGPQLTTRDMMEIIALLSRP